MIMEKKVIEFLLRANKVTYAGKGPESAPSRPNSHDYQYSEGALKYIDTYLGGAKFAGECALWENDVPFWAINYAGRVVADGFSGDFLKEALLRASEEYPFRGPKRYENGDYSYQCGVKGDFRWFYGFEEIFYKGEKVYECAFHGGDVE
ncbi:MAG: DUF5680 domain-containing protein [Defluviitaleaceae bacterium]|nr:DUF5680 domain-containing protein [Defluviitaleaceae bacterium]